MRAVVTAGARIDDEFARAAGTDVKALAPMQDGRTMLDRIVDALRDNGIDEIAVVGGSGVAEALGGRARIVPEASTGRENVKLALSAWPDDEPLLYATSDMPFVTAVHIRTFLAAAPAGAVVMPVTAVEAYRARFPDAPPAGITLGGETVVNGSVFLFPRGSTATIARVAGTFFDARKAPWKMASLVGPSFLLRFAFKRLTIPALEAEAARVLRRPAVALRGGAPELAYDADTADEYRYALERT